MDTTDTGTLRLYDAFYRAAQPLQLLLGSETKMQQRKPAQEFAASSWKQRNERRHTLGTRALPGLFYQ